MVRPTGPRRRNVGSNGETPPSLVMTQIGGNTYPMRSYPTCRVCQSPHRLMIETELVRGASYASIAREVEPLNHRGRSIPGATHIASHVKNNHLPLGAGTRRRLIERRAQEIGRSVEDDQDPLADYLTLQQMIVQRGFEAIQSDSLQVSASDLIQASKFLHQVETESSGNDGDLDQETWRDTLMAYMEIAQRFIPAEHWQAYGRALAQSPVLNALANRQRRDVLEEEPLQIEAGEYESDQE